MFIKGIVPWELFIERRPEKGNCSVVSFTAMFGALESLVGRDVGNSMAM